MKFHYRNSSTVQLHWLKLLNVNGNKKLVVLEDIFNISSEVKCASNSANIATVVHKFSTDCIQTFFMILFDVSHSKLAWSAFRKDSSVAGWLHRAGFYGQD